MKKIVLSAAVALMAFAATAQDVKFGATAGYNSTSLELEESANGQSISESQSKGGFMIGGFAEIGISDKFAVRPEVQYSAASDFSSLLIPINAKYMITEEISALAGPQIVYALEDLGDANSVAVQLGLGGMYQITDNIDVSLRYAFGLTGFDSEEDFNGVTIESSVTPSTLTIAVGYSF
jgi:opacity protein-like surface antigen